MVQQAAVFVNTPDFAPPIIGMGRLARRKVALKHAAAEFETLGHQVRRELKATRIKTEAERRKKQGAPGTQIAKMLKDITLGTSDAVRDAKAIGRGGFIVAN